ncbi:MAG: hypothetical protein HEQ29_16785 [Dolichospermum sp. LBC05a]|nr:hypothetical protein [Dolichospermum sp. OL01]MCO5798337.1 hypothetical protein [Dolichospermum sp. OL03]MCS6283384.1 hypothetical protein [Dolichospermum sp.]QSV59781.1 MAG: hypothetical protein HEQ29_16785 [Dolichospermum sp. LBC05a]
MLKIRNLIFVLGLSPLIFAVWQLPSQAGGPPPGTDSGNNNTGSTITPFSVPTGGGGTTGGGTIPPVTTVGGQTITFTIVPGVSSSITTGASTTGGLSASSTAIPVSTATVASNSSSVSVTNSATGNSIVISLAPQVQVTVNQAAAAITQALSTTGGGTTGGGTTGGGTTGGGTTGGGSAANVASLLTGGAGSQQVAVALTNSFTAAGISPQLATALVTSLTGLFGSTQGSLPNQPLAQATSGQLVASTKALKPILVIAQSGAAINVDINKLNDAIVAYNGIILTSEAENLRKLYKDTDFVGIGKVLKELRKSIQ